MTVPDRETGRTIRADKSKQDTTTFILLERLGLNS